MMKKVLLTAAVLSVLAATPAMAGHWEQDAIGWYYLYDTGGYPKNGIVEVEGKKFCFDSNGYMIVGWTKVDGEWHYCDANGYMPAGWVQDNGRWYYLNADNTMKVGWFNDGKDQYYFYKAEDIGNIRGAVEGAMATGTVSISGSTYYFDAQGKQASMVKSFERDGVTYRYRGDILQWENINEKNDWIQFTTTEDLSSDLQEMLIDRYEGKRTYTNATKFQEEAELMLKNLMTETELNAYIDEALEEYWGSSYKRKTN